MGVFDRHALIPPAYTQNHTHMHTHNSPGWVVGVNGPITLAGAETSPRLPSDCTSRTVDTISEPSGTSSKTTLLTVG